MKNYNIENQQFVLTESADAYLRFIPFSSLPQAENDTGLAQLTERVLMAKHDAFIGHYTDYILFSLTLKNHDDFNNNEAIVMIIYKNYTLFFYDETLTTAEIYVDHINYMLKQLTDSSLPNLLIPYILIRYDLLTDRRFLMEIENTILDIEVSFSHKLVDPQNKILSLRKILSNYKHHYLSLSDLMEDMMGNNSNLLGNEVDQNYQRLSNKLTRLYKYTEMLSEYVSQVNDRYRAQMDLNLNKIMKTFTIISVIFMPLTLIVGWYGMNFDIPELKSKYGYLYVTGLSIFMLIASLLYIKKRGFWD
ncbi:CorA family divalent cation transporter [Wohlfahrtiimonas populi]|uniref:CorA family divalent cation transporter n=1 Tax=Wohlfahrtiimonas populi TaxID=1940240 RepID=UPI00098D336C|nr:CorA family divalent cation transporter [Wohlfahrtiimonas populi]